GSLIYDQTQAGMIAPGGDTDKFTITVDPGQTNNLLLTTDPALRGTLTLAKGSAVIATATASAAGKNVVIQNVQVAGQRVASRAPPVAYTITVGGTGGTTGHYTLEILLNAAFEDETTLGTSNDTNAQAQDLNGSIITLNSAGTTGTQPGRAAVLGSLSAPRV